MSHFCRMKKLFFACLLLCSALSIQGQTKNDSLPYQKYPTLPAFNILLQDSSTIFNTYNAKEGRPSVLFFFSPDCEHCHATTKQMLDKMDSMKGTDFYFFTFMPLSELRPFAKRYHLGDYKNIVVGKDYQYFFPSFYGAKTVPYIVIYDRHKKLIKLYENSVKLPELIGLLRSL